jgi:hypothetical protein
MAVARVQVLVEATGAEMGERTASSCSLDMREIVRHGAVICRFVGLIWMRSQQNGEIGRL